MHRAHAYEALCAVLAQWRLLPLAELLSRIGQTSTSTVQQAGETIEVDVKASWLDARQQVIRVTACAFGPSHLHMERVEESFDVTVG